MKHATDYLTFRTPSRRNYANITEDVEAFVQRSGDWLERLAPHEPTEQYRHNNGEDNADAHLKRHLMSHQVVLPITDRRLVFAG